MNHVNRRFSLIAVVLSALLLGACAGGSSAALSYGDQSISHDELAELVRVVGPAGSGGALDATAISTQSADTARAAGNAWLIDAATADYLGSQGIELTEADRADAALVINQAVAQNELGEVVEGTAAYDFFIRRVWVSGFNSMLQADPDAADVIFGSLVDAEVASNIGVWDADSRQILPPLIGAG